MCPSAPRVCSEPVGQKPVLSLSLDRIAHFNKRSGDRPWHNRHNRTDIVEFGPIPIQFWFIMAKSYREVAIMNQALIVVGQESARLCKSFCTTQILTHWGRVTHICIGNLTIIGSDNGLAPDRRQTIIWTIAGILLIGPLGKKFSEISIGIYIFSFKKMDLNMSSGKWRPSCLSLKVRHGGDKRDRRGQGYRWGPLYQSRK